MQFITCLINQSNHTVFFFQENQTDVTENNTVSQLLAPIITSQRVMAAQFGNTYSSMQCKDKTTLVFDEVRNSHKIIIYLIKILVNQMQLQLVPH